MKILASKKTPKTINLKENQIKTHKAVRVFILESAVTDRQTVDGQMEKKL